MTTVGREAGAVLAAVPANATKRRAPASERRGSERDEQDTTGGIVDEYLRRVKP